MGKRRRRYGLLPTLPAFARFVGVVVAILLLWATTIGVSLWLAYGVWIGSFHTDMMLTEIITGDAGITTITPWYGSATDQLLMLNFWILVVVTGVGSLMHALRGQRSLIERLTGTKDIMRVERDSSFGEMTDRIRHDAGVIAHPVVWLVNASNPIAFATSMSFGRSAIVLSTGICNALSPEALRFVIAHELGHIHYRDTDSSSMWVAAVRSLNVFMTLRYYLLMAAHNLFRALPGFRFLLTGPIRLIHWLLALSAKVGLSIGRFSFKLTDRWVSRHMEYRADAFAADVTDPAWGVLALTQLQGDGEPLFNGLFATHPPISSRIERLNQMKKES